MAKGDRTKLYKHGEPQSDSGPAERKRRPAERQVLVDPAGLEVVVAEQEQGQVVGTGKELAHVLGNAQYLGAAADRFPRLSVEAPVVGVDPSACRQESLAGRENSQREAPGWL